MFLCLVKKKKPTNNKYCKKEKKRKKKKPKTEPFSHKRTDTLFIIRVYSVTEVETR